KHIVGHVMVFPNNMELLATKILPYPLLLILEQVHVIWTGLEWPMPQDISKLLSV
ncbi:hypothetical protein B0T25DRAFT_449875, partial [Lasiosphaeria hispida]